jgi:hypothetical protein
MNVGNINLFKPKRKQKVPEGRNIVRTYKQKNIEPHRGETNKCSFTFLLEEKLQKKVALKKNC